MFDPKHVNDIVKRLMASLPPGVKNLPKDVEKNFHSVLQGAFNKMDLVTREEFDAQTKVLERTRAKLERLEKKLNELEGQ
ncbi:ubiquinone biosynthesis accessory factor UbiK [Candidiatus Paracoxiella cheracis]|uniref:ubiquinone biosynthesis accessory factor UbiK n=1 Tax=Candidiatus Paracoxiella cheracis TaxID=3405120 RepID=UPI003BF52FAB